MKNRVFFNDGWLFSDTFNESMLLPKCTGKFSEVRIPHTVAQTPFNSFDECVYQKLCVYRKFFNTETSWKSKKIILTFEGAAHSSEVFVNGKFAGRHDCGYTPFSLDITDFLLAAGKKNVLAVKLDSRETLNIPPFGNLIDYMTYGGIYREVYLDVRNPVYIQDVFVRTSSNHFETEIELNTDCIPEGYSLRQRVENSTGADVEPSAQIVTGIRGKKTLTAADAVPVVAWSLKNPALYNLVTELLDEKGKVSDTHCVRFGFRDIRFDSTGFYLNGIKVKLRGLNRHQSYPYVGYAMPKNMQYDDADILKFELGLNYVRTSHYPQSRHFLNRCDEIGLLVFTEIPGWQHIGDRNWKSAALDNVRDMIVRDRNHPSIFMWGVRINESADDDEFYERTNALAKKLDPSRPTGGVRCIRNSRLLEDVYTYNDFIHTGKNAGTARKQDVTDTEKGYMITEYNGHMFPTKAFDDEPHRTEHAVRHANVLDSAAKDPLIAGSSGWCAFDYNTHKEFGSGDRICYHGVMDMFRNPKTAAAVYKSQADADVTGDVLEVSSSMSIGDFPAGELNGIWIFTNADSVKVYSGTSFVAEYTREDSPYKYLPHGPILFEDRIGRRIIDEDGISEKYAASVKSVLNAVMRFGEKNLSVKDRLLLVKLFSLRVLDREKIKKLVSKYAGGWGKAGSVFRFEAYREGKLVSSILKAPGTEFSVSAKIVRNVLTEEETYDVTEIRLSVLDENSNLQPYCQEAVIAEASGAVELIGPRAVSLKGGTAGIYVRSCGVSGRGLVTITDWQNRVIKIPVSVKIKKR